MCGYLFVDVDFCFWGVPIRFGDFVELVLRESLRMLEDGDFLIEDPH